MTPKELRTHRLELGMTLQELSEAAGIALDRLDEMERGLQTVERSVVQALRTLEKNYRRRLSPPQSEC